jgi:hypothetical protein
LQKHARQSPREKIPFICPHNSVNKKMSSDRFRKRNYASPQKTQTSIISYNLQKKVNHNPTPDRPLMRSFNAITGSSRTSLSPPHQQLKLSNNPFNPLSDQEEEEEATEVDSPSPSKSRFKKERRSQERFSMR